MKIKNTLIQWLLMVNILIGCGGLIYYFSHAHQKHQHLITQNDKMEQQVLQHDAISRDDWRRLEVITNAADNKQQLTDDQFLFLISEKTKTYHGKTSSLGSITADTDLYRIKTLSLSQQDILYRVLVPAVLAQDSPHAFGMTDVQFNKLTSCDLLARFNIRKAVPVILPLLDDPNPQTRNVAKRDLQKLGYSVP